MVVRRSGAVRRTLTSRWDRTLPRRCAWDELDEIGRNQAARATVSVGTVDDLTLDGEQH